MPRISPLRAPSLTPLHRLRPRHPSAAAAPLASAPLTPAPAPVAPVAPVAPAAPAAPTAAPAASVECVPPVPDLPDRSRNVLDAPDAPDVLAVRGELDFLTVHQLCQRIEAHAARYPSLRLDLIGAAFYDQAAVDALAEAHARAARAGCRVDFVNAPAQLLARAAASGQPAATPRLDPLDPLDPLDTLDCLDTLAAA